MCRKLFLIIAVIGIFTLACGYGEKTKLGNEAVAKIEKFKRNLKIETFKKKFILKKIKSLFYLKIEVKNLNKNKKLKISLNSKKSKNFSKTCAETYRK